MHVHYKGRENVHTTGVIVFEVDRACQIVSDTPSTFTAGSRKLTLGKDGCRPGRDIMQNEPCTILREKTTFEGSIHRKIELGRSWMRMRCVHATRA